MFEMNNLNISQIANFETALDAFEVDNGFYPDGDEGLYMLVEQPEDSEDWRGPYMKKGVPLDPWGNEFIYNYPGDYDDNSYDIISFGPDGREGGDDDITNWDE